jgi:hypothetical protein
VLEAHTITGAGDMLCRVVARSNSDLQRVIDAIVETTGVVRTSTVIVLDSPLPRRVLPLVRAAADAGSRTRQNGRLGPETDLDAAMGVD